VRLGGIYALERIANDSPLDRVTVTAVLTAFVRGHAPWPPTRPGQYVKDAPIEDVPLLRVRAQDVQATLGVLGRPVQPIQLLDLAATDLRRAYLVGAQLQGAYLTDTRLHKALLTNANLQGRIWHVLSYSRRTSLVPSCRVRSSTTPTSKGRVLPTLSCRMQTSAVPSCTAPYAMGKPVGQSTSTGRRLGSKPSMSISFVCGTKLSTPRWS
jgi:hypothetical protein